MTTLLKQFEHFFRDDGWSLALEPADSVIRVKFQGENGAWGCFLETHEELTLAAFYSVYPQVIPAEKRALVAELLTRINYGLIIGNFELSWDDGHLRHKTSIDSDPADLTPPQIKAVVYHNVLTMDRYFPAIVAVLEGRTNPGEAVARVEQDGS